MSYLTALMSNDVPEEGNAKKTFFKFEEEDRIIVPSAVSKTDSDENSVSSTGTSEKKVRKVFKNKNSLRKGPKKSSKKNTPPRDTGYKDAFQKAQTELLVNCRPDKNANAIISQSLEYINNWQGYFIKVDLSEDNLVVNHEDKEYKFSKKRFMGNKYFQNMVRDDYQSAYGNTYLRFFPTKGDENTYTIHVKANRR
jgi:hypothetical protein